MFQASKHLEHFVRLCELAVLTVMTQHSITSMGTRAALRRSPGATYIALHSDIVADVSPH